MKKIVTILLIVFLLIAFLVTCSLSFMGKVTVENKTISSISILRHENGKGKPGEAIVDAMIKSNTPDVELVSGATMSSLVIRSAVIDALENGIK